MVWRIHTLRNGAIRRHGPYRRRFQAEAAFEQILEAYMAEASDAEVMAAKVQADLVIFPHAIFELSRSGRAVDEARRGATA